MAICFEESIHAGAETLIRVGTAGSSHDDVRTGDLAVVGGVVVAINGDARASATGDHDPRRKIAQRAID